MPYYMCTDGPLAGQSIASDGPHPDHDVMVIEVVDVGQDERDAPRFEYAVSAGPADGVPGTLRFLGEVVAAP